MKIFLIILGFIIYGFFLCYGMLIEETDEFIEKSMDKAYSIAKILEYKESDK